MPSLIVVAVDGSENGKQALLKASELALQFHAKLVAVYVFEPLESVFVMAPGAVAASPVSAEGASQPHTHACLCVCACVPVSYSACAFACAIATRELRVRAEEYLRSTIDLVDHTVLPRYSAFIVDSRDPGDALCSYAAEHKADLIVLGTRGMGAVRVRTCSFSCARAPRSPWRAS